MPDANCPTDQTLRNYVLGDCSDAISEEIEGHLSQCVACEATIAQFDTDDDTLIRHLPLAAATGGTIPAPQPGWIDVLRQRPPVEGRGDGMNLPPGQNSQPTAAADVPKLAHGFANYELLGVIGRGGMGVVFLARHRQLNRRVALKVVRPDALSSVEARRRFQREIQILGGLNHPGIVMATDAGTVGSGAYLVMEFIDGADLGRLVRESGPLPVEAACEAGRQIAEALSAAHAGGAVHRDVKPSNTMVDFSGRVRLLDFGLAHLARLTRESGETSVGRLLGTLDYMAPEQADGQQPVDARADLYGLGATLFFLMTGQPPHGPRVGRSLLEHLRAVSHDDAPPVSSIRVDVPTELDALVARLLSRDPAHRPQSAGEVATALSRWAGGSLAARVAELASRTAVADSESADGAAARESLAELLGSAVASRTGTPAAIAAHEAKGSSAQRRRRWRWTALAAFAGIVLAGVTIWLKTPRGTLKIESEVGDVTVEVLDEREQVRELKIRKGESETVLEAGKYRVRLAGPHDGAQLDRDEITLHRGEKLLAKITQVAGNDKEAAKPTIGTLGPGPTTAVAERLYQGRTESEWKRNFVAETEAISKLDAASALLALAAELPPSSQLERILDVGEEIVRASFGDASLEFAFENGYQPPIHAKRWSFGQTGPDNQAYTRFLTQLNDHLQKLPAEDLAQSLCLALRKGSDSRAAFAASLLRWAVAKQIESVPAAVQIVLKTLDIPLKGIDRSAVCLFIRLRYAGKTSGELRRNSLAALHSLGDQLLHAPKSGIRDQMRTALLGTARMLHGPDADPDFRETIARLILNQVIEPSAGSLGSAFLQTTPVEDRSPYSAEYVAAIRARTHFFLDSWVAVANQYLEEHRATPFDPGIATVVRSFEMVLRIRSDGDDWPADKTALLLTDLLRAYYANAPKSEKESSESPRIWGMGVPILMAIVQITGEIPDFVRAGYPPSTLVGQKLREAAAQIASEAHQPPKRLTAVQALAPLIDEAPYDVFQFIVKADELAGVFADNPAAMTPEMPQPKGAGKVPARKGARAGKVPAGMGLGMGRAGADQVLLDPLLFLAVLADLTGMNNSMDGRIANLLDADGSLFPMLNMRRVRELLSAPVRARSVAERILQKMATKTRNDKLAKTVRELLGVPATEPIPEATESTPSAPASSQRLFQGRSEADWKRVFVAETDPVSKLTAANALLALAAQLPAPAQLERILDIGEEIVRASFGDRSLEFAFADGSNPPIHAPRWTLKRAGPLYSAYQTFQTELNDQVRKLPGEDLARVLSLALRDGSSPRAAFAASLLRYSAAPQIKFGPPAAPIVLTTLDAPLTGIDRSAVCLLVRSRYAIKTTGEQRQSILAALQQLAVLLRDAPAGQLRDQTRDELQEMANALYRDDWPPALADALAQLVLQEILEKPAAVGGRLRIWMTMPVPGTPSGSPYERAYLVEARNELSHFLGSWVTIANRYLEEHRAKPFDPGMATVVRSFEMVLRIRSDGDDWPVDKTAGLLTDLLRAYYDSAPKTEKERSKSPRIWGMGVPILTEIVQITGAIPDFVRAGYPPSTLVGQKLRESAAQVANEVHPGQKRVKAIQALAPLIDEAPYDVVQFLVKADELAGVFDSKNFAAVAASPVQMGRPGRSGQMQNDTFLYDPLLTLAILADLISTNDSTDRRIVKLLEEPGFLKPMLSMEHLPDLLSASVKVRDVAESILQKMADRAKVDRNELRGIPAKRRDDE